MDARSNRLSTEGIDVLAAVLILLSINVALFIYLAITIWGWLRNARLVKRSL